MRVHFLLGLAKGRAGGAFAYLLLVVVAARAAHDVYGFQIEMAAVGVGWIVGERDAIEGIDPMERMVGAVTALTTKVLRWFGHSEFPA